MSMTPNSHWLDTARQLSQQGQSYVLVTLLGVCCGECGSASQDNSRTNMEFIS